MQKSMLKNKENYLIIAIMVIMFVLLEWRNLYGFAWNDECFYISSSNRLYLGDKMFRDEWYKTQISSVLTLPFVAIYRMLTGGTEGIILGFRKIYLVFSALIGIYTFFVVKKKEGKWCALVVMMLFFPYAKLSIATLSYNTLAEAFTLIFLLIIYQYFTETQYGIGSMVIAGIVASLAVLANPYSAIGILLYFLVCIFFIKKKENNTLYKISVFGIFIGIVISVLVFCLFFVRKSTILDLVENMKGIMFCSELVTYSFPRRVLQMFNAVVQVYLITIPFYLLTILYVFIKKVKKNRMTKKQLQVLSWIQIVILIINIFLGMQDEKYCGCAFIALGMFGVFLLLISTADYRREIGCWFIPGFIMAILFFFASNTGLISIAAGCLYTAIGTVIVFWKIKKELWVHDIIGEKWIITVFIAIILVILSVTYLRIVHVFRDGEIPQLDTKIEVGPAKGIYTKEKNAKQYTEIFELIQQEIMPTDTVFFTEFLPWGYLSTDAKCGAYTTFRIMMKEEGLQLYYKMHPDNIPNVIVRINEEYGYKNDNNPVEGYLYEEIIMKYNYEKIEKECATIYRKQQ